MPAGVRGTVGVPVGPLVEAEAQHTRLPELRPRQRSAPRGLLGPLAALAVVLAAPPPAAAAGAGEAAVDPEHRSREEVLRVLEHDDLFAVAVPRPGLVVAVGSWGRLLRSEDGGDRWRIESVAAPLALLDVGFAGPERGWIVGEKGLVLVTDDGGRAWSRQQTPTELNLFAVAVIDRERAWAVGEQGTVLRTEDGGRTWSDASLDEDVILNDVFFLDDRRGWIVGEFATILRTGDGGRTWEPAASIEGAPEEVYLFSVAARDGYAIATGLGGTVLRSGDGGRTWRALDTPFGNHLYAVDVDPDVAVAVGDQALIAQVRDGEVRPPAVPPDATLWLRDVDIRGRLGFAVGAKSQIVRSTDAGRTWSLVSPHREPGEGVPRETPGGDVPAVSQTSRASAAPPAAREASLP